MEVIIDDKLSQRERREAQEAAKRTKVARELERIKVRYGPPLLIQGYSDLVTDRERAKGDSQRGAAQTHCST